MSSGDKRPLAEAIAAAEAFKALFAGMYDRWIVAGSVRRRKPEVADIEHVIISGRVFNEMDQMLPVEGLFPEPGVLTKAIYPNGTTRWGDKYRGVVYGGFRHEVFRATHDNFGCILTIRTGPAEFSERMVTQLRDAGNFRQQDGYIVSQHNGERLSVPSEEEFFRLCGCQWIQPEDRR